MYNLQLFVPSYSHFYLRTPYVKQLSLLSLELSILPAISLTQEMQIRSERVKSLEVVNSSQKAELQDYKLLRKVFGHKQVDEMLNQAKEITQSKKSNTRFKNYKDER